MTKKLLNLKKPFARGSEHIVCESHDDDESVYKIPFAWWHSKGANELKSEMDILQNHGVPILETEVIDSTSVLIENEVQNPPYIIRQIRTNLPTLNTTHLQVHCIRSQLSRLLQLSVDLFREKNIAIDFLGAEAMVGLMKYFISPSYPLHVHNFRLNDKAEILLSDTGMLRPEKCKPGLQWGICEIINLQHYLIEGVLQTLDNEFKLKNFDPSLLVRFTGFSMLTATSVWSNFKTN